MGKSRIVGRVSWDRLLSESEFLLVTFINTHYYYYYYYYYYY